MILKHNKPDFVFRHVWTSPIVEIVIQMSVARPKLQVIYNQAIVHQIKSVENVKALLREYNIESNKNGPASLMLTLFAKISASPINDFNLFLI